MESSPYTFSRAGQTLRAVYNCVQPAFRSSKVRRFFCANAAQGNEMSFALLVCLIEIQYMIIDCRLKANFQLLESAVLQISLLDSMPVPNTSPYLQKFSEVLVKVTLKNTFLPLSALNTTKCLVFLTSRHC
jgi:hypothetical protein